MPSTDLFEDDTFTDLHSASSFRSLMRIKNDTGTSINPWGTLLVSSCQLGIKTLITVLRAPWSKQLSNHLTGIGPSNKYSAQTSSAPKRRCHAMVCRSLKAPSHFSLPSDTWDKMQKEADVAAVVKACGSWAWASCNFSYFSQYTGDTVT